MLDEDALEADAAIGVSAVVGGKLRMYHQLLGDDELVAPSCSDPERPHDGFIWTGPTSSLSPANCTTINAPQDVTWQVGSDAGPVTVSVNGDGFDPDCTIVPTGNVTKATCHIRRGHGYESSLEVVAKDPKGVAIREYTVRTLMHYVALGDSYSAGWGLVPYFHDGDLDDPNRGTTRLADPKRCGRSPSASAFSLSMPVNARCTPFSVRSTPTRSARRRLAQRLDQLVRALVALAPLADAAVDDLLQVIAAARPRISSCGCGRARRP